MSLSTSCATSATETQFTTITTSTVATTTSDSLSTIPAATTTIITTTCPPGGFCALTTIVSTIPATVTTISVPVTTTQTGTTTSAISTLFTTSCTTITSNTPSQTSDTTSTPTSDSSTTTITQQYTDGGTVTQTVFTSVLSPTQSSSGSNTGSGASHSSSNTGAIIGGVAGGVVGLILLAALAWFCLRRRSEPEDIIWPDAPEHHQKTEYPDTTLDPSLTEPTAYPYSGYGNNNSATQYNGAVSRPQVPYSDNVSAWSTPTSTTYPPMSFSSQPTVSNGGHPHPYPDQGYFAAAAAPAPLPPPAPLTPPAAAGYGNVSTASTVTSAHTGQTRPLHVVNDDNAAYAAGAYPPNEKGQIYFHPDRGMSAAPGQAQAGASSSSGAGSSSAQTPPQEPAARAPLSEKARLAQRQKQPAQEADAPPPAYTA